MTASVKLKNTAREEWWARVAQKSSSTIFSGEERAHNFSEEKERIKRGIPAATIDSGLFAQRDPRASILEFCFHGADWGLGETAFLLDPIPRGAGLGPTEVAPSEELSPPHSTWGWHRQFCVP